MVVNGQIVIRPIMVVALTYDHRLLDGREAVTFLGKCLLLIIQFKASLLMPYLIALIVKVRDYLEDPRKMLLA